MKIGIASDHAGFKLKSKIIKYLEKQNIEVIDYGTNNVKSVDYPDYAHKLCAGVNEKTVDLGIIICYTGIGVSIASNKIPGIRCAKVCNKLEAKLSREHNNANILALSSLNRHYRGIIKTFINTKFSNDERHIRRIGKLDEY